MYYTPQIPGTNDLLTQLFESTTIDSRFMYREYAATPLQPVNSETLKSRYMNPFTGQPYDGMLLFGEFASIGILNNNNRLYEEENYKEFVRIIANEVASPKGLYGEYEHPKGYAVNGKNLSHKILDIWYDEEQKKVFGYVMILNTPDGLKAQEVIKSGGLLGISARGGGAEDANPDGTFNATLKLLVTFDLVYHPGFKSSLIGVPQKLYESVDGKFIPKKLNESTTQTQQKQQEIIENGQSATKDKAEDKLQNAVDKDLDSKQKQLNESLKYLNNLIHM